jgi:predicted ATPase/class 3 adenylate cyclase
MLAFLFTDIVGSTTRWEHQPQAMEHALARHDELLRQAIDAYGGHVVKTVGDAFQAVFTTASAALEAALAAQRALANESWGPIEHIQVRMAIHVGIVQIRDDDYFGQPLNRVARLCTAGHGGQVLLSNAAQELVRDALPKGAALRDLGEHRLKDLARPERIFQVTAPDLQSAFPPLRSLDRYTHNLPAQPTALIGRESAVLAVADLVRRDSVRLLTLTGPGGTGKTRLALQVAADLLDAFHDGVWFVALAPIREHTLVLSAIAQALGVVESTGQTLEESLKAYLRSRQALLVLDNFEQVLDAGPLIAALLAAAPALKVLVTSREMLHLYGEHEYEVPPLSLPDLHRLPPIERLTQYEAVRLFIERAQAVRSDFAVTGENAPAIAEICVRLDGLPLAIELAAARSKLFPPKALLARLDKRLALLTGGPRDLPARQQTLRNAISWSYDLLDPAEQTVFARLGVFVGGCTLESAEAVLADDRAGDAGDLTAYISVDAVLDGLTSLVDKSLLKQAEDGGGEPRFVMLETIREYALEQLEESGEEHAIRRRHATFCIQLAETTDLNSSEQRDLPARLAAEQDNVRSALAWSVSPQGDSELLVRLAGGWAFFWFGRGYINEGWEWLSRALERRAGTSASAQAKLLLDAGLMLLHHGKFAQMEALLEESLSLFRELGDRAHSVTALLYLGIVALERGDYGSAEMRAQEALTDARDLEETLAVALGLMIQGDALHRQGDCERAAERYDEALARARALEGQWHSGDALKGLGRVAHTRGQYHQAQALLDESLLLLRKTGISWSAAETLIELGRLAYTQGDDRRALTLYRESLAILREIGQKLKIPPCLEGIAAAARGQPELAARLLGAAAALRESLGTPLWRVHRVEYDQAMADVRAQLGEGTFAAAWEAGRALPLDQAIAEALAITC